MAEVFDPADLNKDGKVNFIDEEMAAVLARKELADIAKEAQMRRNAEGDVDVPFSGLTDLQKLGQARRQNEATRRDNEALETSPVSEPIVKDDGFLSTLPRASNATNLRFQEALGEDVILTDRKSNQSTDSQN